MGRKKVDPAVSAYMAAIGRAGGSARVVKGPAASFTEEERKALGRKAAAARWGKKRAKTAAVKRKVR